MEELKLTSGGGGGRETHQPMPAHIRAHFVPLEQHAGHLIIPPKLLKSEKMDPDILTDEQLNRSLAVRIKEIILNYLPLGYVTFGGPSAHVALLHDKFVVRQHWLPDEAFGELFGLSQALPGPASTQLAFAIAQLRDGVIAAIWGWVLWTTPGFIVMSVLAYVVSSVSSTLPPVVIYIENGLVAAAVGLVALAAYRLGQSLCKTDFSRLLALLSFGFTINYPDVVWLYPVEMAVGGLLSWVWLSYAETWFEQMVAQYLQWKNRNKVQTEVELETVKEADEGAQAPAGNGTVETVEKAEVETRSYILHTSYGIRVGLAILTLWVVLLVISAVVRGFGSNVWDRSAEVWATFYFIGSLTFGGGPVVIPLIYGFVVTPGWVTDQEFLLGLAIINVLPGPNFNFGAYCGGLAMRYSVGALIAGCFIAEFGMFVPGLLLMAGLIPLWQKYRTNPHISRVLRGVNAAAAGLVFAVTYNLYEHAYTDPMGDGSSRAGSMGAHPLLVLIAAISFIFSGILTHQIPAPLLIIVGGLVGLFMWIGAGMP